MKKLPNIICVGAQWGDEGKGKIIDVLSEAADIVVRSQGGNNAGHTVKVGGATHVLHLVPSGILHKGKVCVIGNGVVADPLSLLAEIEGLRERGIKVTPRNLLLSESAHMVLPYHRALDVKRDSGAKGPRIGTTRRGIGPAYADKVGRTGLRLGDLARPDRLADGIAARVRENNRALKALGEKPLSAKAIVESYLEAAAALAPFVTNTVIYLHRAMAAGKRLLFEGAQGTFLDIDHGTYPYVTSSNTTAGGACTGSGVAPHRIGKVLGVLKAYTTRVGEGPLVTEDGPFGDRLHAMGREFGATTGRARRCGWFDAVATRYAAVVNGLDALAITNLDGLDGLETLRVCVAYKLGKKTLEFPPADAEELAACRPIYLELPGWKTPTAGARTFAELPAKARAYVKQISQLTGAPAEIVSVGPKRSETIFL